MRVRVGVAVGMALAFASPAGAQSRPEITGSVRGGYWSSTRDLDDRDPLGGGMMWLKARMPLPSNASVFAEGWGALRGPPERGKAKAELREGYVTASSGSFDLKLGRQIIAWGRADGVNPTGNLVAEDLTLLTPDDADRRLGVTSAVGSVYVGGLSLTGLWLPEFRGHRFPLPAASGATFIEESPRWPGDQWAVRAERTGGSVDWSASFFRGLDLLPDVSPGDAAGQVALHHRLISVAGIDAATNVGRYGLRGEAAYVGTADKGGADPFRKNPFLFFVVGGDRTYEGRLNLNLQYIGRVVLNFLDPADTTPGIRELAAQQAILSSQSRRVQHGASMRSSVKWRHETLETELAAMAWAAPRGVVLRPKVTYALSDRVLISSGGELYRGRDQSLFRMLRPNSTGYLEARWGF